MIYRSDFFEKSLFVRIFMILILLFIILQLNIMGRALHTLLNDNLPDYAPAEIIYGFLPIIMMADLLTRFFLQKLPSKDVQPYLHLPISRHTINTFWMIRALVHPFNFYLLFLYWPMIQQTLNPEKYFPMLAILAIFFLGIFNQMLIMWIKLRGLKTDVFAGLLLLVGSFSIGYTFYTERFTQLSLNFLLQLAEARLLVWIPLLLIVGFLALVNWTILLKSYYNIVNPGEKINDNPYLNFWEKHISSVSRWGEYWLLEWRLITRNKRSKSTFYLIIPFNLAFLFYLAYFSEFERGDEGKLIILILLAGGYGITHLQHAFSWESHFFDFLSTRNFPYNDFIMAKYYFYLGYALVQFIITALVMIFFNPYLLLMYMSLMLYSVGFGFFLHMRMGIKYSDRFNANGKASFNMEGVSGMKLVSGFLFFIPLIFLFSLGVFFPKDYGIALWTGLFGLSFIVSYPWWIKRFAKQFEERKYTNLARYREK
ncbi:MAG: DUF5687 family protein [Bacteroidota bacterium]